jgi:hypothetical protein
MSKMQGVDGAWSPRLGWDQACVWNINGLKGLCVHLSQKQRPSLFYFKPILLHLMPSYAPTP